MRRVVARRREGREGTKPKMLGCAWLLAMTSFYQDGEVAIANELRPLRDALRPGLLHRCSWCAHTKTKKVLWDNLMLGGIGGRIDACV